MDEKEVANLGENLLNRRETREKALSKSEEELSKIDQRRDPQAYAECQEEIRRRKEELESIKEDIEKFNELQEELNKLNVDKKKNEFNEKSEKLRKAQDELSKIDQGRDPQAYAECQEEIRRRQEEFDVIKNELNDAYKNKSSIEKNLKNFTEKYNIDQSKKRNDTADTRDSGNSAQAQNVKNPNQAPKKDEQDPAVNKELEEKRKELNNLKKSILANGGNITPEQVDKIKKLQQEIKDLQNGKNVQPQIEDKHKDQQRIEDKHKDQPRIEDKHQGQLRIEDKHKGQLRLEDKHKEQLRIEDKHPIRRPEVAIEKTGLMIFREQFKKMPEIKNKHALSENPFLKLPAALAPAIAGIAITGGVGAIPVAIGTAVFAGAYIRSEAFIKGCYWSR